MGVDCCACCSVDLRSFVNVNLVLNFYLEFDGSWLNVDRYVLISIFCASIGAISPGSLRPLFYEFYFFGTF
jgi:hypothetical protein